MLFGYDLIHPSISVWTQDLPAGLVRAGQFTTASLVKPISIEHHYEPELSKSILKIEHVPLILPSITEVGKHISSKQIKEPSNSSNKIIKYQN